MCFKGMAKLPKPIDISMEMDGLGAESNAFMSQESTSYYAKRKRECERDIGRGGRYVSESDI